MCSVSVSYTCSVFSFSECARTGPSPHGLVKYFTGIVVFILLNNTEGKLVALKWGERKKKKKDLKKRLLERGNSVNYDSDID